PLPQAFPADHHPVPPTAASPSGVLRFDGRPRSPCRSPSSPRLRTRNSNSRIERSLNPSSAPACFGDVLFLHFVMPFCRSRFFVDIYSPSSLCHDPSKAELSTLHKEELLTLWRQQDARTCGPITRRVQLLVFQGDTHVYAAKPQHRVADDDHKC